MTQENSLSIAEAGRLIRGRELTPVELTGGSLARIETLEPELNSFITITADQALDSARQAERSTTKGPLHGIPIALKDIIGVAGVRLTAASKILSDNVAAEDAEVTTRLKSAGAVILGKLNLHEFAYGATGVNPHFGAAHNPWDRERITGGSSSGSGASVAAGECFGALGTDTGGSIRIPASLCGIVGLKPTYGRVSKRGVIPLSWSLDHIGPMTRTVEDAAIILQAIAGHDPLDESSSERPVDDYVSTLKDGISGLRIGVPKEVFFENLDPEVQSAVRAAIKKLEEFGAHTKEISLPHIDRASGAVGTILVTEALAYHQHWLQTRPQDYGDDVRTRLELGKPTSAVAHIEAQRFRHEIIASWRAEVFDKVDLIVTPTTAIPAVRISEADLSVTMNLIRFTNPVNLLGLPAISVPCGFTDGGLPIGLQLIGRWWDEATVLRAAHAYEQATDWHKRRPPL